jgi:division protein CdvB (Snf7/Vps24/ESCRT-III family)
MNDFERESSTMDMKEEMMSDAVDDAMEDEDEGEGEEAEGDKILKEVLDEIGMGMNDAVSPRESRPEAEMSDPRTARRNALKRVRQVADDSSHPHLHLALLDQKLLLLPEWLLRKDYPLCLVNLGVAVAVEQ